MQQRDRDPIDINPDPQTADRDPIQLTPGEMEDIETASALANRTEPQQTLHRPAPDRSEDRADAAESSGAPDAAGGDGADRSPEGPDWTSAADPMR